MDYYEQLKQEQETDRKNRQARKWARTKLIWKASALAFLVSLAEVTWCIDTQAHPGWILNYVSILFGLVMFAAAAAAVVAVVFWYD